MKTLFSIVCFMVLFACATVFADSTGAVDTARIGGKRQEEIQAEAQKLTDEVNLMLDEYQRNGISGEEIKNLKNLQKVLVGLSTEKMEKIVNLLREASVKNDQNAALSAISNAYSQQKGILVKLNELLAIYEKDREALEISNAVKQLADRQATNLQIAIEVARWSLGDAKDKASAIEASLNGQSAEEKAIADELKLIEPKIDEFSKKPGDQALADRFKKGLEEIAKVKPVLDASCDALQDKKLFEAVGSEKTARDQMRQLARTIAPPRDPLAAMRDALEQLEKLIAQQGDMIDGTEDSIIKPIDAYVSNALSQTPLDKKKRRLVDRDNLLAILRRDKLLDKPVDKLVGITAIKTAYEAYKRNHADQSVGLENQQGDLLNQSDALSQDLEAIAKSAGDLLKQAIPPMQSARGQLNNNTPGEAVKSEKSALDSMEKAKAELERLIAAADKKDDTDPITALKNLQKETQKAIEQQKDIQKETGAPKTPQQTAATAQKQDDLKKKTQELQQQASDKAPDAAQSLDNAAKNMDQAAKSMNTPPNAQAQQSQALQNLQKASDQLGQQIAKMEQAQQNMSADQQALDELQKIIEAEQKLQMETADATPQHKRDAIVALAPRQQENKNNAEQYKNTLSSTPQPNGSSNIGSACAHMQKARESLENGNGADAEPEEKKALDDLYAAKNALEAQMQAAQQQAGQDAQQQPPANAAQTAEQVAQAQAQLQQAMQALEQGKNDQAAADFKQAAQTAAQAATQAPPGTDQKLSQAASALAEAAGQAQADNKPDAQAKGEEAGKDLAQAAAAAAQAQSGIAQQHQGPPQPGMPPATGEPDEKGNQAIIAGIQRGDPKALANKALFPKLPPRERKVLLQSQSEKYPPQYAAKIEQYLQNLAEETSQKK